MWYIDETTHDGYVGDNEVEFQMVFAKPVKINVKEEYLIYDMVSMIGAIGGTMGLCIGFSFRDCARWALSYIELSVNWYIDKRTIETP